MEIHIVICDKCKKESKMSRILGDYLPPEGWKKKYYKTEDQLLDICPVCSKRSIK